MHRVATGMPSQVAVEFRTDVIQFVEDGHELFAERLVEESRQTEREYIEHFALVHEEPLNLIIDGTVPACERAIAEPQRRDACLEPVAAAIGARRECKQHT